MHRVNHTRIVAYLALFAALAGGVAYAAEKVGSKQIKPDAIKSKHVKANSLTGADVAEETLSLPAGAAAGLTKVSVSSALFSVTDAEPNEVTSRIVVCEPGEHVVGGGGDSSHPQFTLIDSEPVQTGASTFANAWSVAYAYDGSAPQDADFEAHALCLS